MESIPHEVGTVKLAAPVAAPVAPQIGSVRARANKYRLCWDEANPGSCGLQDGQHGHTPPEVEQSASVGGNMLMVAGAEAEEVAQFVVGPAEPGG
jgi:hypothetical protein